jgi:hypothetical protein
LAETYREQRDVVAEPAPGPLEGGVLDVLEQLVEGQMGRLGA